MGFKISGIDISFCCLMLSPDAYPCSWLSLVEHQLPAATIVLHSFIGLSA
jgi:hypothetical protein